MEHNSFITLNDDTEITYSDVKSRGNEKYITIYFETPVEDGFLSADIDYPNGVLKNNTGYNQKQIDVLMYHYKKVSKLCFEFALEDRYFGMENKIFLEMDDSENKVKDIRPLTQNDDLLLLRIANKYHHSFESGSPLDTFGKNYNKIKSNVKV